MQKDSRGAPSGSSTGKKTVSQPPENDTVSMKASPSSCSSAASPHYSVASTPDPTGSHHRSSPKMCPLSTTMSAGVASSSSCSLSGNFLHQQTHMPLSHGHGGGNASYKMATGSSNVSVAVVASSICPSLISSPHHNHPSMSHSFSSCTTNSLLSSPCTSKPLQTKSNSKLSCPTVEEGSSKPIEIADMKSSLNDQQIRVLTPSEIMRTLPTLGQESCGFPSPMVSHCDHIDSQLINHEY